MGRDVWRQYGVEFYAKVVKRSNIHCWICLQHLSFALLDCSQQFRLTLLCAQRSACGLGGVDADGEGMPPDMKAKYQGVYKARELSAVVWTLRQCFCHSSYG